MPSKQNYFFMSCNEIRAMRKKGKRATVHVWIMQKIIYWLAVIMLVIFAIMGWLYIVAFADKDSPERQSTQEMLDYMRAKTEILKLIK